MLKNAIKFTGGWAGAEGAEIWPLVGKFSLPSTATSLVAGCPTAKTVGWGGGIVGICDL